MYYNILCDPVVIFMVGHYAFMIITIALTLLVSFIVMSQSQNETKGTDIGENQSISGQISGFGGDLDFGPRVVDDPALVNSS